MIGIGLSQADIFARRYVEPYRQSKFFVPLEMPDWRTLRRLRFQGEPYRNCPIYTIVYEITCVGQPGDVLACWEGNALDCPSTWWWDDKVPWCWFTTDYFTTPTGSLQSWTVDGTWNNASNLIQVFGAGGGGDSYGLSQESQGGGGGGYSAFANLTLSSTASWETGASGTATANSAGGTGGSTWFNGSTIGTSSCGATGGIGASISNYTATQAPGGTVSVGTGYSGGAGGYDTNQDYFAGGGGGAGGPNGVGGLGSYCTFSAYNPGSGGGGGNGGGSAAPPATNNGQLNGYAGGTNYLGAGSGAAGTGGATCTAGNPGSAGGGGGGGGGTETSGVSPGAGGAGGAGTDISPSYGGGGGGGGGGASTPETGTAPVGGAGGTYGGGGGGGGFTSSSGLGGVGGSGLALATWTPGVVLIPKRNRSRAFLTR